MMTSTTPEIEARIGEGQGLVRSLAQSISRRFHHMIDLQDLIGYGQVGLAQAAHEFDASRKVQFSTYAYYRIRGAIYDGAGKMAGRAYAARRDVRWHDVLEHEGTEPAPHSEDTGEWLTSVAEQLATAAVLEQSVPATGYEPTDDSAERPVALLCSAEFRDRLHRLVDELPSDSAALIRASYFSGRNLTEAAEHLGISKSWASRVHARALKQLAESLRNAGYDGS